MEKIVDWEWLHSFVKFHLNFKHTTQFGWFTKEICCNWVGFAWICIWICWDLASGFVWLFWAGHHFPFYLAQAGQISTCVGFIPASSTNFFKAKTIYDRLHTLLLLGPIYSHTERENISQLSHPVKILKATKTIKVIKTIKTLRVIKLTKTLNVIKVTKVIKTLDVIMAIEVAKAIKVITHQAIEWKVKQGKTNESQKRQTLQKKRYETLQWQKYPMIAAD